METKKRVVISFGGIRVAEFDDFKDAEEFTVRRFGNKIHCIATGKNSTQLSIIDYSGFDKEKEKQS